MNEEFLINSYLKKLSKNNPSSLNLNDDVFFDKSKKLVISVDTYINKSHFYDFRKPDLVIKKILRSSLSDLICKGVTPKYYFLSGGGNKTTFTKKNLSLISKSLREEQNRYSIKIGGGDTVAVINLLDMNNKFNFVSTAGGAFLEYLEGRILPGIKALN